MNSSFLSAVPVVFADIVIEPPQPPPGRNPSESFFGEGSVWSLFWLMAIVAAGVLWWLRQRRTEGPGDATKGA